MNSKQHTDCYCHKLSSAYLCDVCLKRRDDLVISDEQKEKDRAFNDAPGEPVQIKVTPGSLELPSTPATVKPSALSMVVLNDLQTRLNKIQDDDAVILARLQIIQSDVNALLERLNK